MLAAQQDLAFCFVCVKCWELLLCFFFGICCEFCLRPVGELVAGQTAMGKEECQWALTENRTLSSVAAHLRLEIIVSLRMAASAEAPSAPMRLFPILRGMGVGAQ